MDSDEQAIRDLVSSWAAATKAGDVETVLNLMDGNAVFLVAGQAPMRGRAAFVQAMEGIAKFDVAAQSDIQEIKVFGDWAYCWNHLQVTMTPASGGPAVRRVGDVLSVLRRREGRWMIYRDANLLARTPD
jgi:uncharacterized protein (TIGR02246 family)